MKFIAITLILPIIFNAFHTLANPGLIFGQDNPEKVENEINSWNEANGDNVWEHSGLEEGDIIRSVGRNGLRQKSARWDRGIIPYRLADGHFDEKQTQKIMRIINEYNKKTCLEFRPFDETTDDNYIDIIASYAGCWSSVGVQGGQQFLNLQLPMCMRDGTIRHELLHAIGFEHQQSSSNRDDFLKINWDNIVDAKKHNFVKYPASRIANFGVDYDYSSIMHYSGVAFSKNGEPTMVPLKKGVTLVRKNDFSEGDLKRLAVMYKEECAERNAI